MKKIFLKAIQALLVLGLAFTLTNCGNDDNPLEDSSSGGGNVEDTNSINDWNAGGTTNEDITL